MKLKEGKSHQKRGTNLRNLNLQNLQNLQNLKLFQQEHALKYSMSKQILLIALSEANQESRQISNLLSDASLSDFFRIGELSYFQIERSGCHSIFPAGFIDWSALVNIFYDIEENLSAIFR